MASSCRRGPGGPRYSRSGDRRYKLESRALSKRRVAWFAELRAPPQLHLTLIAPQDYAAEEAGLVGDDTHILAGLEEDFFGVAAAQVELVPVEELFGLLDGRFKEVVPAGLAEAVEAAAADVVLVGHALLAPGVVAQLEAGNKVAVGEEGRAEAGAQGQHQFHAIALDGAIAGHVGVVAHADGLLPALFKLRLEWETAGPQGMEVEAEVGAAVLDDSGETDGDEVEGAHQLSQFVEPYKYRFGRGDGWRYHALALADGLAGGVEEQGLEAGATDVDGHGDGAGWLGERGGRRC